MNSFFGMEMASRLKGDNAIVKLERLVDWKAIEKILMEAKLYKSDDCNKGGQTPYSPIKMFKAMVLGSWFNLSDPQLEENLNLRMDFIYFTGFQDESPDETTLCRFRNLLTRKGLQDTLFRELNRQLSAQGLIMRAASHRVVDATLIESACRPNRVVEMIAEERKEDQEPASVMDHVELSKDRDARWLKKGSKSYFGYKGFFAVDSQNGCVLDVHVTPANKSETKELRNILSDVKNVRIYADKGYASEENRQWLADLGAKDGIMEKASKSKKLSHWQKVKNKLISNVRYIVEQTFGIMARRFGLKRTRFRGLQNVLSELYMKAMTFNMLKLVNASSPF